MHPPILVALTAAVLVFGAGFFSKESGNNPLTPAQENALRFQEVSPERRPAMCFAPGTPVEIMSLFDREEGPAARFQASTWWTQTATDGFTNQGDAITLRWSIVPDGTLISGGAGEPTTGSNLRSWLNNQYGSIAVWLPLIEQSFARWGDVTGVTYIYEPDDDGAALNSFGNNGVIGLRGDVRIGGHTIDGFGNTLAYNYFPNSGDMVIDTGDGFFNVQSNNSRRLRNVIMHEHGHGLGLDHSCPANRTKLMEPFIVENFEGPQLDDILGGQRNNGDPDEDNDSVGAATPLGTLEVSTISRRNLSIDDNSDMDFFSFTVPVSNSYSVDISITPTGRTYPEGPQNADESCSAGTDFDSLRVHDLGLELRTATAPLATSNTGTEGSGESISGYKLSGTGPYYIRVFGDASNSVQAYELSITIDDTVTSAFAFSTDTYFVDEDQGKLVVSVSRTGDTAAEESVNFATTDDSAVGGIDFISAAGTLNFAPGQVSGTFDVTVLNNETYAGERKFSLSLSNASGNAVVGTPNIATATIAEDDKPGTFVFENNEFSSVGTIPGAADGTPLAATVYPMTLDVSNITGSVIRVSVKLTGVTHEFPRDMDILLVGPTGEAVMLLSDAGGGSNDALSSADLMFDDSGAVVANRDVGLVPGASYTPINLDPVNDVLLPPAPPGPFGTSLSAFANLPPEGTWSLYFMDDWASDDIGSLGGFSLAFTTTQTATIPVGVRFSSIQFDGKTVTMEVISTGDATFALQRSDKLSGWATVDTGIIPGTNPWTVADDPPASGSRWFYRLVEE